MPDRLEEPGPNPQSYDIDYSQSRGWGHQGCLDHSQEGQEDHFQVLGARRVILGCFHNFSIADFPLMEPSDGLSVIGF